jgi:hypothetical protein
MVPACRWALTPELAVKKTPPPSRLWLVPRWDTPERSRRALEGPAVELEEM